MSATCGGTRRPSTTPRHRRHEDGRQTLGNCVTPARSIRLRALPRGASLPRTAHAFPAQLPCSTLTVRQVARPAVCKAPLPLNSSRCNEMRAVTPSAPLAPRRCRDRGKIAPRLQMDGAIRPIGSPSRAARLIMRSRTLRPSTCAREAPLLPPPRRGLGVSSARPRRHLGAISASTPSRSRRRVRPPIPCPPPPTCPPLPPRLRRRQGRAKMTPRSRHAHSHRPRRRSYTEIVPRS